MSQVWIYVNGHITDVVRTEELLDEGVAQESPPTLKLPSGQTHDKVLQLLRTPYIFIPFWGLMKFGEETIMFTTI